MKCKVVLPLSMVAACLGFLSPNYAEARSIAGPAASTAANLAGAAHREAMKMVPARADLIKALDASNMRAGRQFEARLSKTIHLKSGIELPGGTTLLGKVVADTKSADGKASTVALRFAQAKLKDGKMIPIKATIVGLYPSYSASFGDGAISNYWTPSTLQVDQLDVLKGVNLHSKIAARDSGVLVSNRDAHMKIGRGTEFALAIAGAPPASAK